MDINQGYNGFYRTPDLYFAAFLMCTGTDLERHEKNLDEEGKLRTYFLFTNSKEIWDLKRNYVNRKASVEPQSYADRIRSLKGVVHQVDDDVLLCGRCGNRQNVPTNFVGPLLPCYKCGTMLQMKDKISPTKGPSQGETELKVKASI